MILQGHRGARQHYPENTFPSYYGAIKEGYSFIELDTKFTKDNRCVLLHDQTVERTGRNADGSSIQGEVQISELTFEEVRKMDFGIWFAEEFKGTKIPELTEVLDFVKETKMPLKFDNVIESATDEQIDYFLDTVQKSGVEEYIGITAKTLAFVDRVTSKLDKCFVHYDGPTSPEIYEQLKINARGHRLFIWLPSEKKSWLTYPVATKEDVEFAKQYGLVGLWTAHDKASLDYILSMNPDGMELDGPFAPCDLPEGFRKTDL